VDVREVRQMEYVLTNEIRKLITGFEEATDTTISYMAIDRLKDMEGKSYPLITLEVHV